LFGWRLELHLNFSELCLELSPADPTAHPHLPEGAAGRHDVAGSAPQDDTSTLYGSSHVSPSACTLTLWPMSWTHHPSFLYFNATPTCSSHYN